MCVFLGIYTLSQEDYTFKMLSQPVHGVSIYARCVTAMPLYWSDIAKKYSKWQVALHAEQKQIIVLILRNLHGYVIYTHVLLRLDIRTITSQFSNPR